MLVEVDNLRHEMQQTLDISASQLVERSFEVQKRELNRTGPCGYGAIGYAWKTE
jgi:hypothetical protein